MYLSPTSESIAALTERDITGPVTMLNLLRFRDIADYSDFPDLAPAEPVSGEKAYEIYSAHTLPLLAEVGGKPIFMGDGGSLLIGPADARWDRVLLVQYPNMTAFLAMTQNPEYHAGAGHRTAALADSRLLPIV
ncbi:MAG: DUF1330 domain-containing protein [Acidimicrobiia bacterium]|nr:MAG: DUF1330 domain-containing protein [Acidimicrobiia bacterium]